MTEMGDRRLEQGLAKMASRNPQTAEEGFAILAAIATDHVEELIGAFEREDRHDLRCWLIELIGAARSPKAFETLCAQTQSDSEAIKKWAVWGLTELNTKDARTFLFENNLRP